ncbi:hypothetical protein [Rhodopseudomonas sp. BR0G17]|uniref:hypothetical protein n=1 Tax=Rhodopseudomonas sp. BR0G17 TaxID=2269368 RepID=UPI0013DF0A4D|nr:hypothetical protein [Rhodopseudomonas sp. BR0G17]NEW97125.1 hypothetical protein [Rhodopseudomonas sp. BR0G17]
MKAKELANYFSKKIVKPITYSVAEMADSAGPTIERTYSVEPIAVSDEDVLHALVTLKARTSRGAKLRTEVFEAEVDVPLKDGDNLTMALIMAIIEADEGQDTLNLSKDDYRRRAHEILQERLAEWK